MRVNIRGALGTQFMSVFILSTQKDLGVTEFVLSAANCVKHAQILYVPQYLVPKKKISLTVDFSSMIKSWNVSEWPEMTVEEYEDRWKIFNDNWEMSEFVPECESHKVILHARGTDRPFLSKDILIDIASKHNKICVTGEDPELTKHIPAQDISTDDPVKDWLTLQNADEVHGGCSTFMMSAAMCAPDTNFIFYKTEGMDPNSEKIIDRLVKVLPNAIIYN
tara:strand:+ start:383 stop:1045 length:663 start_codon:yes stop_codon:yes gene_type:complete